MELLVGSSTDAAASGKTPKKVRIIVTCLLMLFYAVFIGFFVYISIDTREPVAIGVTVLMAILIGYVFVRLWRKIIKGEPLNEWDD